MIALIDNYDSFTFNVYDYLRQYGAVRVFRNTDPITDLVSLSLRGLVISPGPSHPSNALLALQAIRYFAGKIPILGICLGMQALGYAFGHTIRRARCIMHGKVDTIAHLGGALFSGIEQEFQATRYHSLVVDISEGPFHINALSKTDGEIMAIEDPSLRLFGLQFHPESYATRNGMALIKNFMEVCHGVSR